MAKTVSSQIRKFYNEYKIAIKGMFAKDPTRTMYYGTLGGETEYSMFKKVMLNNLDKDAYDKPVSNRALKKAWEKARYEMRSKEVRNQEGTENYLANVYGSKKEARKQLGVRSLKGITVAKEQIIKGQATKFIYDKQGNKRATVISVKNGKTYTWTII